MGKYATFQGRASRSEFWGFVAVATSIWLVAVILSRVLIPHDQEGSRLLGQLVAFAHLLPWLAVSARRLHDEDRSGRWVLLNGFPPLGSAVLLIWACYRGTVGPNRFGPDPLQPDANVPFANRRKPALGQHITPPAPAQRDLIGEIERLSQLRRDVGLSEAEFEVMKAEAISRGR